MKGKHKVNACTLKCCVIAADSNILYQSGEKSWSTRQTKMWQRCAKGSRSVKARKQQKLLQAQPRQCNALLESACNHSIHKLPPVTSSGPEMLIINGFEVVGMKHYLFRQFNIRNITLQVRIVMCMLQQCQPTVLIQFITPQILGPSRMVHLNL